MSNRTLDEIHNLEVQLREFDSGLNAAMRADVVDLRLVRDARARRAAIITRLASAKEAIAR